MNNENKLKPIPVTKLGPLCEDFLRFKRATGLKYTSEEKSFRYFIRYCNAKYPEANLPEDAIFNWINESDNRSLKTKSNYSATMAIWAEYMFSLGYIQMRLPDIRHSRNTAFVPHVFTANELNAIWSIVDNFEQSKVYPNLHRCIPVLFRLLYSCGLRISEALAITANDINFDTNIITLKHTKLDKERLIPMCGSLAKVMKKYVDGQSDDVGPDSPIFYYRSGQVLTQGSIYKRFRLILQKSGIPYEGKLRGPRIHDFRHTFAVVTMNRLCDEGKDLYVALPILAAYLGHSGVKSTERYIRLTEDRLSTVTDSMQFHLPEIFPEVKENEEF
ncbi:tyrosine-type recombinase/integrase [Gudongella sp. SC589]|uniref:tyrosine-type recombinase/integrase n=1 Tax=Gudongella sp. SC589 TaxID=3385990 RepID=UPI00390469B2